MGVLIIFQQYTIYEDIDLQPLSPTLNTPPPTAISPLSKSAQTLIDEEDPLRAPPSSMNLQPDRLLTRQPTKVRKSMRV